MMANRDHLVATHIFQSSVVSEMPNKLETGRQKNSIFKFIAPFDINVDLINQRFPVPSLGTPSLMDSFSPKSRLRVVYELIFRNGRFISEIIWKVIYEFVQNS